MNNRHSFLPTIGLGVLLLIGLPATNAAAGGAMAGQERDASMATATVEGELVRIEGDVYVVRDERGKELRLHVDFSTDQTETLTLGDIVVARITEDHHALSIKPAARHAQPDALMER